MIILNAIGQSLYAAAGMLWEILWALIFGFALSGVVMAFVPKNKLLKLLGRPRPKEIGLATFLGSVSSSCSYAAAAMARSLFQKGAHIVPSLAFMLASTNLVIELSAVLWIMMGWQFVVGEFIGGLILVAIMSALMILLVPLNEFEKIRAKLNEHQLHIHDHQHGHEHHHEEMDRMGDPTTLDGWTLVAQSFFSEWRMIWQDIVLGLLISGFLMVLVPNSFWQTLFLNQGNTEHFSFLQAVENALVGPIVSVLSFVCSVGNIPLASVLYHGGITFGGALSFIYADLIIVPLILIYKKYFGTKAALWITAIFYASMVITGLIVDLLFHALGWVPAHHEMPSMSEMHFFLWNYTTWFNIAALVVGAILFCLANRNGTAEKSEHCCH